jgi:hypothetical protein
MDSKMKDAFTTTTACDWWLRWCSRQPLSLVTTKRTLGCATILLLAWFAVTRQSRPWRECRAYGPIAEYRPVVEANNNGSFLALSVAQYNWGYYYSYKQGSTGATHGPRVLLLVDKVSFVTVDIIGTNTYGMQFGVTENESSPYTDIGGFELSIGKDANGNVVWSNAGDTDDGVVIDPSVVHLRFSNGATYSANTDAVFFISFAFVGKDPQIQQRPLDLSTVSANCGMKRLFRRNAVLQAFHAQWQTDSWYSPKD